MTPREAAEIAVFLANAPASSGGAWSLDTQSLFADMIEDLPAKPAKAAAMAWVRSSAGRPSVAEFRGAVRQQLEAAGQVPADPEPGDAWGIVVQAFARVGRYREFPATHPAVKRTVDRIGWLTLCDSDNPEADRAHFLRLYAEELGKLRQERHAAKGLSLPNDAARLELAHRNPDQLALGDDSERDHGRLVH